MLRRQTRQRTVILELLNAERAHPHARQLLRSLRRHLPHISLGTVYRNLGLLCRQGSVRALVFGEGPVRFDAVTQEHAHFYCERCGHVSDITFSELNSRLKARIEKQTGGMVLDVSVAIRGRCAACVRSKGKK